MGTTTNGLPYPEPTDPVADGATAIKNLALAIQSIYRTGSFVGTITPTGGLTPTIAFGKTFAAIPSVQATPMFATGGTDYTGYIQTISTSGFVYRLFKAGTLAPSGEAVRIEWAAWEKT